MGHDKFQTEAQQSAISEFVVRNVKKADTTPAQPTAEVEQKVEVELETA
jgi:hypothetical protein